MNFGGGMHEPGTAAGPEIRQCLQSHDDGAFVAEPDDLAQDLRAAAIGELDGPPDRAESRESLDLDHMLAGRNDTTARLHR